VTDERIHPKAAAFSSAAGAYEHGRPAFPAAGVDWLCERLEITQATRVCDLAAGTGRLTRPLHARTHRIIAIEPVAEMRAVLQASLPGIEVLDGIAEEIPLATDSVDVVVVAQAFHWFDPEPALSEIARVLVPGGRLGVVWHVPDPADPVQMRFRELVERHRHHAPARITGDALRALEQQGLFEEIAHDELRDAHTYDRDRIGDLALSTSHIAALPDDERARALDEARSLIGGSPVELVWILELNAYRQAATTSH
jgi:SAM-dependent methyltransferase